MTRYYTEETGFFGKLDPQQLIAKYGSPLYVYNERIFRKKILEMKNLVSYKNFMPNYSIKANSNLHLLRIVREEGIFADAMSPGEIYVLLKAGFEPKSIFYVSNNVSDEEFRYAIDNDITTSVDSLSQLERFGKLNPTGRVAVRFNPGVGAGHHEKVITGGKKTKFGINMDLIPEVKDILKRYELKLVGINQHIGSLFLKIDPYLEAFSSLLGIAANFEGLEFIDLGGGFGIQYMKQEG
jgi:diaminopimelate decarboxylase